ncbi:MAG: S-layer homology domain-containing protein [Firmicutes bacterium]|nr:S-layer homology domain-containing protein [Bacillota bacterium]
MNKRVVSLVLALVMILTMVPMTAMAASASDFSDVEQGKWYYTWIDNVAKEGYYAGYADGTFRPNVAMTRAMFVMVLANMEEAELDNSVSAFKDVEAGKWYTGATKWASDNKIVAGYTDGTFKPDTIVTREQMATIMQNYINWRSAETGEIHETEGSTAKFADDAKISKYAKEAVANCREWGLVDGYTDGTFRPQNGSTRAEVAAVISKLAWMVMGGGTGGGPRTYSVTYYANANGDDVDNMPGKVTGLEDGETIEVADGPDRDGYIFLEWNTKANGTGTSYDEGEDLTINKASVKLYAQWEEVNTAKNDFILKAVKEAAKDAEKAYKEYVNTEIKGSTLKLSNITVKEDIVEGARPQKVTLTGKLYEGTVRDVAKLAVQTAVELMTDNKPERPEIESMAHAIVDALEDEFGVNIFYPETKQEVIDAVTEEAWAKVGEATLWDHFHNNEGAYYTDDITVSVGKAKATLTVDEENNETYFAESKKDKAEELGVAIAKELYGSLIKASNGKYISAAKVEFVLDVDFSAPTEEIKVSAADADGDADLMETTYRENAQKFPTCYPVTIVLDFQNPDDMGVVAYKFEAGKGSSIKLTATKEMQKLYLEKLESAAKIALESERVQNKLNGMIEGATEEIQSSDVFKKLTNALAKFLDGGKPAAEAIAEQYIDTWTYENMDTDNLYESNVFDMLWNDKNAETVLENDRIYELVKITGEKAAVYANKKMDEEAAAFGNVGAVQVKQAKKNADVDYIKDSLRALGINLGVDESVENYVYAVVADKLRKDNGGELKNYAAQYEDDMQDYVDEMVAENVEDAIESHEYYAELQNALKAKDIKNLKDAQLGNLATVLDKEMVQDEAEVVDEFMDEFVKVFRNVPKSAAVTVNGKTIKKATLDDIKNLDDASKAEEVVEVAAELLADPALAELSVSDFAGEGQKIKVEGKGYSYEFYLVIEVK